MPAIYASMRSAGGAALYPSMGEAPAVVVPNAPTGVTATPTGGTTATFGLTDTNGGTATYRWQISLVGSGTWADAVGGANPSAGATFSATGGTPATEWLVRARGETGAGDSAWVQAATSLFFDNTGTGGGVIGAADSTKPTLTGVIAITAPTSTSYTATCPAGSDAVGVTGYQWRLGGTGAWTDIASGGRIANFTGRTPASTDALEMRCRDAAGNFSDPLSTAVTLLGIAPAVTTQPANASVVAGATATFTAAFSGTPAPTVQWSKNGATISGATSLSYSFTATLADTGAIYTCTATNSAGSVTTNAAVLTVTAGAVAPSIVTQPASQNVVDGSPVTFSVVVSGTAPISGQWQRNGLAIPGATSTSYTFTPSGADNGAVFSYIATNAAGIVTSASATLIVTVPTALTDLDAFMPFVLPNAAGCPWELAEHHVRQACIEWFQRTLCWRKKVSIASQANVSRYPVTLAADEAVAKLLDGWVNGAQVSVLDLDSAAVAPVSVTRAAIWTEDRASISVNPVPQSTSYLYEAQLAIKPSQTAASIPSAQFEQYAEAIAQGALARILKIKGKQWTDVAGSIDAQEAFDIEAGKVASLAARGFGRTDLYGVRPNWF